MPLVARSARCLAPLLANCLAKGLARRAQARAQTNLKGLDFFEQMLTPAGDALRPEYALDGTHLGPAYLKLVEAALHKVME